MTAEKRYRCAGCEEWYGADGFYWYKDDGRRTRQTECIACRKFMGELRRQRREHFLERVRAYMERAERAGQTVEAWQLDEVFGVDRRAPRLVREMGLGHLLRDERFWTLGGTAPDVSWRGLAWGSQKWGVEP